LLVLSPRKQAFPAGYGPRYLVDRGYFLFDG